MSKQFDPIMGRMRHIPNLSQSEIAERGIRSIQRRIANPGMADDCRELALHELKRWRRLLATGGIVTLLLHGCTPCPAGEITERKAVRAIVGESGGEPFAAQMAVAGAIRNRGSLRGVYGVSNPCVGKASAKTFATARRAWRESATNDVTHGLRFFSCAADAPYFRSL